jgi:hypothetical protein
VTVPRATNTEAAPKAAKKPAAKPGTTPAMSDAAVAARTGKAWPEWFALLDDAGAASMDHRQIVAALAAQGVGPWWCQMVAVAYERARGKRVLHETSSGFAASVSRTVSATLPQAYAVWERPTRRKRFLTEDISFSTRRDSKVLRFGWRENASRVSVSFTPRSRTRTQVTVTHEKLKGSADVTRMKAFWSDALDRMQALVEDTDA